MSDEEEALRRPSALYEQIARRIQVEIAAGKYGAGDLLPSEAQLAERYKVSRQTIRQAIASLRTQGLVDVQHGRGTFVRKQRPILRVANNRFERANRLGQQGRGAFVVELERQGMTPRSDVTVEGPIEPTGEIPKLLALSEGEQVVSRRRLMFADDEPVQIATSYIPWPIAEGTAIVDEDSGPGGIYARIEEAGHQLAEFEEEVGARPATPAEADVLDINTGAPVILVTRVAYDTEGQAVEVCQHVMNADRYRLTYRFSAT